MGTDPYTSALEAVAEAARELVSWNWLHLLKDYGSEAGDVCECTDKLSAAIEVLAAAKREGERKLLEVDHV